MQLDINSPDQFSKKEIQILKITSRCGLLGNIRNRQGNLCATIKDGMDCEQSCWMPLEAGKTETESGNRTE